MSAWIAAFERATFQMLMSSMVPLNQAPLPRVPPSVSPKA